MTSIFKLVCEKPSEFPVFITKADGKKKISQKELITVDYSMPGLMFDKDGCRVPIPETDTDHIDRDLVSLHYLIYHS